MNRKDLPALCKQLRRDIINMIANGASGHPGGSLSVIDMLVALYFGKMNLDPCEPVNPQRDRLVLSKGHAAPALYACLGELGLIEKEEYTTFRQLHSRLQGHPDRNKCPGVEVSTGSLGQGCSIATGVALGAKACGNPCHIYAVLGDGECQEGIVWEASMAAAHYRLDNLTFLIDHNGLQIDGTNDEVMSLGDLKKKFESFGFKTLVVENGNDVEQILAALDTPVCKGKPRCIICETVKGKGVSFMENQVGWHGKAPNEEQRRAALRELGE